MTIRVINVFLFVILPMLVSVGLIATISWATKKLPVNLRFKEGLSRIVFSVLAFGALLSIYCFRGWSDMIYDSPPLSERLAAFSKFALFFVRPFFPSRSNGYGEDYLLSMRFLVLFLNLVFVYGVARLFDIVLFQVKPLIFRKLQRMGARSVGGRTSG